MNSIIFGMHYGKEVSQWKTIRITKTLKSLRSTRFRSCRPWSFPSWKTSRPQRRHRSRFRSPHPWRQPPSSNSRRLPPRSKCLTCLRQCRKAMAMRLPPRPPMRLLWSRSVPADRLPPLCSALSLPCLTVFWSCCSLLATRRQTLRIPKPSLPRMCFLHFS